MRFSQQRHDAAEKNRWLARLSESERKNIKQLLTRQNFRIFIHALDELFLYVGLWPVLQIGTFHKVINLKCPEVEFNLNLQIIANFVKELRNYLHHVRRQWDDIMGYFVSLNSLIDYKFVQFLKMRSSVAFFDDGTYVQNFMNRGVLFSLIIDNNIRQQICRRIFRLSCMIFFLFTFFENTKWLEFCAKVVRSFLSFRFGIFIRTAFFKKFENNELFKGLLKIENSAFTFKTFKGNEHQAVECEYVQFWMTAWREFFDMISIAPRKDVDKLKPQIKTLNEHYWNKLAKMAFVFEFRSKEINRMQTINTDWIMTQDFFQKLRPSEFFQMFNDDLMSWTTTIWQIIDDIRPRTNDEAPDSRISLEVSVEHRCGRPHENSHKYSRGSFFMKNIYGTFSTSSTFHFEINRDIFRAFFGSKSFLSWESPFDRAEKNESPKTIKKHKKFFRVSKLRLLRSKMPESKNELVGENDEPLKKNMLMCEHTKINEDINLLRKENEPMNENEEPSKDQTHFQRNDFTNHNAIILIEHTSIFDAFVFLLPKEPDIRNDHEMITSPSTHKSNYSIEQKASKSQKTVNVAFEQIKDMQNDLREIRKLSNKKIDDTKNNIFFKFKVVFQHSAFRAADANEIANTYNEWKRNCEKKDLLLVDAESECWIHCKVDIKSTEKWFAGLMNERFFCCENSLKKQFKTITAFHHERYAWDPEKNRNKIIYAFRYRGYNSICSQKMANIFMKEDLPHLNEFHFESTTQMLTLIDRKYVKKTTVWSYVWNKHTKFSLALVKWNQPFWP